MRCGPLIAASLLAGTVPAMFADARAQSTCGSATVVAAGETLAEVAERCGVSLEALRATNPEFAAGTVEAGAPVEVPEQRGGLLDRAREAVRSAGEEIEGAARRAGQSATDYLSENPDLSRDLLEFGQRLGLPGVEAGPQMGANVTVQPASLRVGGDVTVNASGLRGDTPVTISAGAPGEEEREVLHRARTDPAGRVEATFALPEWAAEFDTLEFAVETDRVRVTSEPVPLANG